MLPEVMIKESRSNPDVSTWPMFRTRWWSSPSSGHDCRSYNDDLKSDRNTELSPPCFLRSLAENAKWSCVTEVLRATAKQREGLNCVCKCMLKEADADKMRPAGAAGSRLHFRRQLQSDVSDRCCARRSGARAQTACGQRFGPSHL